MCPSRVLIVGAGMTGLTAALHLREQGIESIVLDKGHAPGGRMATRTVGAARFDHGAQHFSPRSLQFQTEVNAWIDQAVVAEWFRSPSLTDPDRGIEARYVGIDGMRRIPEAMAADLDVRTSVTVERLEAVGRDVAAVGSDGVVATGAAVILTPPVPQARRLLEAGGMALPSRVATMLDRVEYNPCIAVMALLDGPSGIPAGHLSRRDEPIGWIADNQHKGVSTVPAVTIHSTPGFAMGHLEETSDRWLDALCRAAAPHLESRIADAIAHRWRYAQPRTTFDIGAVGVDIGMPVVMAGEVFAGARVEGAYESGIAAAALVLEYL